MEYRIEADPISSKESADIAKKAINTGASVREVLRGTGLFTIKDIGKLLDPETMV